METKIIDLKKNVHELCTEYPEVPGILAELGFADITKPGMLNTAGRFMTIPMGASMKKISLDLVKQKLFDNGFEIKE